VKALHFREDFWPVLEQKTAKDAKIRQSPNLFAIFATLVCFFFVLAI